MDIKIGKTGGIGGDGVPGNKNISPRRFCFPFAQTDLAQVFDPALLASGPAPPFFFTRLLPVSAPLPTDAAASSCKPRRLTSIPVSPFPSRAKESLESPARS